MAKLCEKVVLTKGIMIRESDLQQLLEQISTKIFPGEGARVRYHMDRMEPEIMMGGWNLEINYLACMRSENISQFLDEVDAAIAVIQVKREAFEIGENYYGE